MPDLTTKHFWHCVTAESWERTVVGSTGEEHTVTWNNWEHKSLSDVQYDYSCNCRGYTFGKGKYCNHIEQVKKSGIHCKWMQFSDGDDVRTQNEGPVCPKCGAMARASVHAI